MLKYLRRGPTSDLGPDGLHIARSGAAGCYDRAGRVVPEVGTVQVTCIPGVRRGLLLDTGVPFIVRSVKMEGSGVNGMGTRLANL